MRMERYNQDQDFLALHSSYRHDLKTQSSDQGRCIKTAAAFLKGFLNIEGQLAPIITTMVMSDKKAESLLDCTSAQNHSLDSGTFKTNISKMLNSDKDLLENYSQFIKIQDIREKLKDSFRKIKIL